MEVTEIELLARQVEAHPDYRVLRRLSPRQVFGENSSGAASRAIILDTETTGTDPSAHEVIELGMVAFDFDPTTGKAIRVVDVYDALEQPSVPIPPDTTRIHGITDEMVAGKRIDDQKVEEMLFGASLVIAHNAQFDRQFLEKRLPIFQSVPWGCSLKDVPWAEEGYGSAKLDYILNCMGFFHEAHRAEADCLALLEVLQFPLPVSGITGLMHLLSGQQNPSYRVWARNSPFDNKDRLKARGYRWEANEKCWFLETTESTLQSDLAALKQDGYNGKPAKIDIEKLDSRVRFSSRGGEKTTRVI